MWWLFFRCLPGHPISAIQASSLVNNCMVALWDVARGRPARNIELNVGYTASRRLPAVHVIITLSDGGQINQSETEYSDYRPRTDFGCGWCRLYCKGRRLRLVFTESTILWCRVGGELIAVSRVLDQLDGLLDTCYKPQGMNCTLIDGKAAVLRMVFLVPVQRLHVLPVLQKVAHHNVVLIITTLFICNYNTIVE